jgi:CheY-like chemotaxis protein
MLAGGQAGQSPNGYILLAEDDDDDVELLTNFLRDLPESPEVMVLNKGDKVISFFENLSENRLPQLIILDYNLPTVSGYEILTALAKEKKYHVIPKIVWSTSGSPQFETQCLANGATAYFVKPADLLGFQTLVQKLQQFLSLPIRQNLI